MGGSKPKTYLTYLITRFCIISYKIFFFAEIEYFYRPNVAGLRLMTQASQWPLGPISDGINIF